MQQLHLVGITTEMDGLIFSGRRGARTGSFVVPINEELVETIAHADRLRREAQPAEEVDPDETGQTLRRLRAAGRPESKLTPREMQARLRAGQSVGQVARAAGVGDDWVERWAAPIAAEQARILDMALALTASNTRSGRSAMVLSDSVRVNLHERGVPLLPEPEGWSARNLGGGRWAVRFEYVSRRRRQAAEWDLDLDTRELTPRNRLAADIGHVGSVRRRVPAPPPPPPSDQANGKAPGTTPVKKGAVKKTGVKKAAVKKAAVKKAAVKKAPARKPAAKKVSARKTPARKTTTRKAAARKAPSRRAASGKAAPGKKTPVRKALARRTAARRRGR